MNEAHRIAQLAWSAHFPLGFIEEDQPLVLTIKEALDKRDAALARIRAENEALRVCGNCIYGKSISRDDTRCYKAMPYLPTGRHCKACADWERSETRTNPREALARQPVESKGEPDGAEIARLRAENEVLRAALSDMIGTTERNTRTMAKRRADIDKARVLLARPVETKEEEP